MRTDECLAKLAEFRTDEVVIAAMTSAVLWPAHGSHPRDLIYVPSTMGGAPALGLGLALARPEVRVIVLNGDGSMLMSLGCLVSIAEQAPPNLALVVLDNGMYAVTGGQPTPGAGRIDFAQMATAAGWRSARRLATPDAWAAALPELLRAPGPHFAQLTVAPEPTAITPPPEPMGDRLARLSVALGKR
jgi:thiamine pyrophosphate-dependent acetolactate synthase large subunit-like protein